MKLENFLYERRDSNHLKLIDFGFSTYCDSNRRLSQTCGSLHYVAPEVLNRDYTEMADMWSVGIIAYMLLTGNPPFFGSDDHVLTKIRACEPHYSSRFQAIGTTAQEFVKQLLVQDPKQRLDANGALNHPWIASLKHKPSAVIDTRLLKSFRDFAHATPLRRGIFSMMAWSLSSEDRRELGDQFLSMDKQHRGTISLDDLVSILQENFHMNAAEAMVLATGMTSNFGREIVYSEFLAAALSGRVEISDGLLCKAFARFDHCGQLMTDDFRAALGDADKPSKCQMDFEEFCAYINIPGSDDVSENHGETLGAQETFEKHPTPAGASDCKSVGGFAFKASGILPCLLGRITPRS
jgi:calcium-dependent protein kinase